MPRYSITLEIMGVSHGRPAARTSFGNDFLHALPLLYVVNTPTTPANIPKIPKVAPLWEPDVSAGDAPA